MNECVYCKTKFKAKRQNHKYCSKVCCDKDWWSKKLNKVVAELGETKADLILGIELEVEYNQKLLGYIKRNIYHSERPIKLPNSKYFCCEDDGSISTKKFRDGGVVEIISKPFKIKDMSKVLEDFRKSIYQIVADKQRISIQEAEKKFKLSQLINFNKSCGCHIHFSICYKRKNKVYQLKTKGKINNFKNLNPIVLKSVITMKTLNKINDMLHNEIKEKLPKVYEAFESQFYRNYASKMSRISHTIREKSFNFRTIGNEHIEFRSFNLCGVTNWNSFNKMFEILANVFNDVLINETAKAEPFKVNRSVKEKIEYEIVKEKEIIEVEIPNED
jgi:hypothetical protein